MDRITQSIACCLSSVDAVLMEALELLVRGSIGCWHTTLLDAVSSVSGWRHCGLYSPMTRGGLSCLTGMGSSMDSMRMAYEMNVSGGLPPHRSSRFTSYKEDGSCVSSDIVATYEDGVNHKHGCIQPSASSVDPTSSHREGLFTLLLNSSLFQDVHSDIHYSLAMLSPINERLSITSSDFFMIHFCARRIAILLTCLIAHRFNAPAWNYRWLVGILHCRIASSNRTQ